MNKSHLVNIFSTLGIDPVNQKSRGHYLLFHTPLRPSGKTSFFVYSDGTWEDRGLRDFEGKIFRHKCDDVDYFLASGLAEGRREAKRIIRRIEKGEKIDIGGHYYNASRLRPKIDSNTPIISEADEITDTYYINYIIDSGIDMGVAGKYLRQVRVEQGKTFRALDDMLSFGTDAGSRLLFSEFETRWVGQASMTTFPGFWDSECVLFSHPFDFLRWTSAGHSTSGDIIIMNHIKFFDEMLSRGSLYRHKTLFLRNTLRAYENVLRAKEICPEIIIKKISCE